MCGECIEIETSAAMRCDVSFDFLNFQRMVCHGQHTYVYSQVLIQVLSQELKGGFNMKRLSQEITKYALQK